MVPNTQMRPTRATFMFLLMPSPWRLKAGISGFVFCLLRWEMCVEKGECDDGSRGRRSCIVVVEERGVRRARGRNMVDWNIYL